MQYLTALIGSYLEILSVVYVTSQAFRNDFIVFFAGRLALYGQKLLYKVTPLVLESCPHCVASFSHALATKVQALSQVYIAVSEYSCCIY